MLSEMRELALQNLLNRCQESPTENMSVIRKKHSEILFPLLLENSEKIERVYILESLQKEEQKIVKMHVEELDKDKLKKLPFIKPTGAQSPAVGPILKRTSKPKDNPPYGPSPKVIKTTLTAFENISNNSSLTWSSYFKEILAILNTNILEYEGTQYTLTPELNILDKALSLINEKSTVFVTVADSKNQLPGERQEYLDYLAHEMAEIKYVTASTIIRNNSTCPLCGKQNVSLYPNAVKGAGLNIGNVDRAGAFANLDISNAWKNFALCLDCADLLYVFKNHLLPNFITQVAGEKALLIPSLLGTLEDHQKFIKKWNHYINNLKKKSDDQIASYETKLLKFFKDEEDNQLTLQLIWATFGQHVEDIKGWVTDILPSRLQKLHELNEQCNQWQHPLNPQYSIEEVTFDLGLNMLLPLFKRMGGKKAKDANKSKQLFDFKRQLLTAIYHCKPLLPKERDMLWYQIIETAYWHLMHIIKEGNYYSLLYEDKNKKYLTFSGWIRHIAKFLYYLDQTGVLTMEKSTSTFQPQTEVLKPFLTEGSGINSDAKVFAFILGVLFGKLMQVQVAKGVNINSNALTWLKRLELTGKDLPELYCNIRGKFLFYGFEKNKTFLSLETDLATLGTRLGNEINLDKTTTCYFLLLGQSLSVQILSKKDPHNLID